MKQRRTEEAAAAAARGGTAGDSSAGPSGEMHSTPRMAAEKTRSKPRRRARGKVAAPDDDPVVMGSGPRPAPTLREAGEVYAVSFESGVSGGDDDDDDEGADDDGDAPAAHVAQKQGARRRSRKSRKMSEKK